MLLFGRVGFFSKSKKNLLIFFMMQLATRIFLELTMSCTRIEFEFICKNYLLELFQSGSAIALIPAHFSE
jgi:hypothetical protein